MSDQLFSDLLVIDCASFIAGPAAATMLADFGARVIKIEPPGGDGYRMLAHLPGLPVGDSNYPWDLTNRSKESLALDLKQSEGRALLDDLIERADVFITNLPLPVRDKLRLGYEAISEKNPDIIYASLTPYGEAGPEAGNTGYDATAWWARSGLMDQVRASPDLPPGVSAPGMGDHMAANALYGSIVTALYRRQRTGEGAHVGSSLMGNGIWSNGLYVQAALDGADVSPRMDVTKVSGFTNSYQCRDGRWLMLAILLQAQEAAWPKLAGCLGREELLEDERFATVELRDQNKHPLREIFQEAFAEQDWDYWKTRCAEYGITCGAISRAEDLAEDEQALAAGIFIEGAEGARTIDSPMFMQGEPKTTPRPAPAIGEHSDAILRELGVDDVSLEQLRSSGTVVG